MNLQNHLVQSREFAAEYDDELSNHLPMALFALGQIGASDDQLGTFYQNYSRRLEKQSEDLEVIDQVNWKDFLGQHKMNSSYRKFFEQELQALSLKNCLSQYLPILIPGVSGGAFHPLIRLAYAIEMKSLWEVAEALASWCMAYQELGQLNVSGQKLLSVDPARLDVELYELRQGYQQEPLDVRELNVFQSVRAAADSKVFLKFFPTLDIKNLSLDQVRKIALAIYASSNDDFSALHFVTASHALRVVVQQLDDSEKSIQYLFQSIVAGYLSIGCPRIQTQAFEQSELPSWSEIFSVAQKSSNDHLIKLIYTAHQEFLAYQDDLYHFIAAKKARLW